MKNREQGLTEIITGQDGLGFQISSKYIHVHLPDGEILSFSFRTSAGEAHFYIPCREDLNILVMLIKKGRFRLAKEGVHIKTILKTKEGEEYVCYLPH